MCVVSMVGDHYRDKWEDQYSKPYVWPGLGQTTPLTPVSRYEFDELKREVQEMIALLKRAKKYDEDNGEKDCEIADKMDFLRKVAKSVGVDLDAAMKAAPVKKAVKQ